MGIACALSIEREGVKVSKLLGERMKRILLSQFLLLSLAPMVALSQVAAEKERLSGFAEHQKGEQQFDVARQQGERAYFEKEEQWEVQRERARLDYQRHKTKNDMAEDGPEARADIAEKKKYEQEYEKSRVAYEAKKAHLDQVRRGSGLPTEEQEYGLNVERPRYDYKKRASFGAPLKLGSSSAGARPSLPSSPSFGGGYVPPPTYDPGPTFGGDSSFPPPPTFDDFGGEDGGYVPAPNMEDYGDVPPPPPPPPFGDDFGGGFNPDFPPPPPPPPPFGEDY